MKLRIAFIIGAIPTTLIAGPKDSLKTVDSDFSSVSSEYVYPRLKSPQSLGFRTGVYPYSSNILMSQVGSNSNGINFYLGKFGTKRTDDSKGVSSSTLKVSGIVRFMTYYRDMSKAYDDMTTSPKNLSFTDYPIANIGSSNFGGYPNLELNLSSSVSKRFNFNVGYSMSHAMTGDPTAARTLSSLQNLTFTGNWSSGLVKSSFSAGGVIWPSLSRLTMGQPWYRENYFYRLPWDWHRNSFQRYTEYYDLSQNLAIPTFGRSPFKGVVWNANILPWATQLTFLYGRTNRNVTFSNQTSFYPSATYAFRISKNVFERYIEGDLGFTFYKKDADTDRINGIADDQEVYSIDWKMRRKGWIWATDIGMGKINNPSSSGDFGAAFVTKLEATKKVTPYPASLEFYYIQHDYASIDGSVVNSNASVEDGGVANEFLFDNMLLINLNQEVGMLSNNRMGLNLKGEAVFGKLKAELGYSASQEIENIYDTVTFQHRANAFSRSRFRPWYQAGGPYSRIKSYWLTTFETVTITDAVTDYKKGFNNVELMLKYKTRVFGKSLVLLNFNNYTSTQDSYSVIPVTSDQAFVRTTYNELVAAMEILKKTTFIVTGGVETVKGNNRTQLSPVNNLPLDQKGWLFALGVDYDLTKTANIHLRHKWYGHKDENFVLDEFKGQETVFEFKLFF